MDMTKGIVITCHNNGSIDYLKLAEFFTLRAKHFLNLPVSLITDTLTLPDSSSEIFDSIIYIDTEKHCPYGNRLINKEGVPTSYRFINGSRMSTYFLSPYKKTLSIDIDYIISNSSLLSVFEDTRKLLCNSTSYNSNLDEIHTAISKGGPSTYWTTVMYFEKCDDNDSVFSKIEGVRNNWKYYIDKYNIPSSLFRNDFAFAIVMHELSVDSSSIKLPIPLINLGEDEVFTLTDHSVKIEGLHLKENVHAMNKFCLQKEIKNAETLWYPNSYV